MLKNKRIINGNEISSSELFDVFDPGNPDWVQHVVSYQFVKSKDLYEIREWCRQMLQYNHIIGITRSKFENESDMMLFMLRW